ncbi:hypothetical protein KBZ21_41795, partial [Streptomyces sp. A73]|nr:hypothetical protein [Streptomyces sp. A73]
WLDVLHQLDVHDGAFIRALTREGRLQSRITATERGDHVTGDAWFIARHSPARVLAEVDAKRGLLDRYAEVADMDYEDNEP